MSLPATYRPLTIDCGIRAASNRAGGKIALSEGERRLTYRQLVERVDRVAAVGAGLGLGPGDHAALLAGNCLEYIEIVCGLSCSGIAVATPSPRLAAGELGFILQDCAARILFVEPALETLVRALDLPALERIVVIGSRYEALLAQAHPQRPAVTVQEWENFSIPYTSGTTGKPKGVLLSHRARTMCFGAMAVEFGCYSPDDRALATAPLCHGAGLAFALAPVFFGGTCDILPRFDPGQLLARLDVTAATNVFLVPTHFHAIFGLDAATLDSHRPRALRSIISNAAALPQATKERIVAYFGTDILHECYGATETGIVCNLRPPDQLRKTKCVGLPFPYTEVRILREDGSEAAPGEIGELFSTSPTLFNGYWNRPEETAAALRDGKWVSVGDLATRDDEGYLYIVDRKKDMIISGGLNIYPREIEEALFAHPAIADAAVIGIPDAYWGETLKAFVVLRPGAQISPQVLQEHCRAHLSSYKVPHAFDVLDSLPRNPAGKVLKTALREREAGAE
ncbi:MAG: AMP-binding protein [Acetobacteraceae bacterium]